MTFLCVKVMSPHSGINVDGVINYGKCRLNYQLLCLTSENGYLRVLRIVALTKFIVGDGAGAVSAVPSTVGGAGGLLTIGAGAGA